MSSSRGASGTPSGRPAQNLSKVPSSLSGPRRSGDVTLLEGEVLIEACDAMLDRVNLAGDISPRGIRRGEASSGRSPLVRVTAVLERTRVDLDPECDRRLVSKKNLRVEVDKLPIRRRGVGQRFG